MDSWEDRFRKTEAAALKAQSETERIQQRLSFFQEGLMTLLHALPVLPTPSQIDNKDAGSTTAAAADMPKEWPPAPAKYATALIARIIRVSLNGAWRGVAWRAVLQDA